MNINCMNFQLVESRMASSPEPFYCGSVNKVSVRCGTMVVLGYTTIM